MRETKLNECVCDECGHIWHSVIVPQKCSACRSRRWNASASAASAKPPGATRGKESRLGQEKPARLAGRLDAIAPAAGSKTGKTSELTYILDE